MHIEQERTCELCLRVFAIEYEFVGERLPTIRDTITMLLLPCPRCGHANQVYLIPYAGNIVCRRIEAPRNEEAGSGILVTSARVVSSTRTA
jgi:hypothetical protein